MKSLAIAAVLLGLGVGSAHAQTDQIKFYTSEYIGDDIAYENVGCGKPVIPEVSKSKVEIKKVTESLESWSQCYNAYTARLASLQPVGKALPAGLAEKMTPEQLNQAKNRMAQVYNAVMDDAEAVAKEVTASRDAWYAKTNDYLKLQDARLGELKTDVNNMLRQLSQ